MTEQVNDQSFKSFTSLDSNNFFYRFQQESNTSFSCENNSEDFDFNSENNKPLFEYNKELYELLMNEDYNENSDSDFSYSEYEDEFNEREIIEINEEIQDEEIQDELEVIPEVDTSHKTQTSCVIVDYIEGKIQTCNSTDKLRRLKNLFGSWQIDRDIVNAVDKDYLQLGVCYSHFLYDQNQLHNKNDKQKKSHKTTLIQRGRCIGFVVMDA
ncbi:hypothetical protein Glove_343g1 [Diversispora epigaea]|uniref:Uncharacterized protein n=1 Tax=Diversispora epigaea TaxID=1348612 RepID=A0A397HGI4_9GLOM|nr:hypothetical protein Glove_343g1 [Diversispora epigaea]